MTLEKLLMQAETFLQNVSGALDIEIQGLAYDSRKVGPGFLFFALPGELAHGQAYVEQAVQRGAVAVLSDKLIDVPGVASLQSDQPRLAMAHLAVAFHRKPAEKLKVVGVTGTNGKTTVAYLVRQLVARQWHRVGMIGTVGYEIAGRRIPSSRTTPESVDLQALIAEMRNEGCRALVMEVSSHALVQQVAGLAFDVGIFTNLSQDHLDFHGTMEKYFEAKLKLFEMLQSPDRGGVAVVHADGRWGEKLTDLIQRRGLSLLRYGQSLSCDFRVTDVKMDFSGTRYALHAQGRQYLVRLPLIGRFNVANSVAALAAVHAMGLNLRQAIQDLAEAEAVPGRLQLVPAKKAFKVFVDYAHTPDALVNVLRTLRELNPARIITIFGCGGERDKAKRVPMGRAVDELSDYAIITSDNPRGEEPQEIIRMIEGAMTVGRFESIEDRREAIFRGVAMAEARDIVLIAGKGHETYQQFSDRTLPFDDVHVALWALGQPKEPEEGEEHFANY